MPSRHPAENGGVYRTPSFTMKMFSPGPSVTWPAMLSMIPSSYPALSASILASPELMY